MHVFYQFFRFKYRETIEIFWALSANMWKSRMLNRDSLMVDIKKERLLRYARNDVLIPSLRGAK